MKLKNVLLVLVLCAGACASAEQPVASARPRLTPEQRAQRRAERAKRLYEMNGGLVQREYKGKVLRIVSTTDKVAAGSIDAELKTFRSCLSFPVEVVTRTLENDPKRYLDDKAGTVIVLSENPAAPVLLVAPEEKWAIVNVGKLAADGADCENQTEDTKGNLAGVSICAWCWLCGWPT